MLLRDLLKLKDCDLFDLFAEIGFGVPAKTRGERVLAFDYKNKDWLLSLPGDSANVIKALARQFEENGFEELESPEVFDVAVIKRAGGIKALAKISLMSGDVVSKVKMGLLAA